MKKMPKPGLTIEGTLYRVVDGDTLEISVTRTFKVRLLDPDNPNNKLFGCAEKNTDEGKQAIEYLESILDEASVTVFIPNKDNLKLVDFLSFDRVLGEVWKTATGENVAQLLEKKGYAKKDQHKE